MSERIIVMDHTILEQINVGNAPVATVLRGLKPAEHAIWVTREDYARTATDADRLVLDKFTSQIPLQDDHIQHHERANGGRQDPRLRGFDHKTMKAAALALRLRGNGTGTKVEFLTANAATAAAWRRLGGALVPEMANVAAVPYDKARVNYVQARRLLGLPLTVTIVAGGRVLPVAKGARDQQRSANQRRMRQHAARVDHNQARQTLTSAPPARTVTNGRVRVDAEGQGRPNLPKNAPPPAAIDGKVVTPNNDAWVAGTKARTGQPPKVDPNARPAGDTPGAKLPSPSSRSAVGIGAGVQLLVGGGGMLIHWLNDEEQKRRYEADWAPKKRTIDAKLAAEPELGALILVYYSQRTKKAQENDAPSAHTRRFLYILYEFGVTELAAFEKLQARPELRTIGQGELAPGNDRLWVPPTKPIEPHLLPVPMRLGKQALATFTKWSEVLMDVKWGGMSGFDDDGETVLDVLDGVEPLFVVLMPPDEIRINNGSLKHTVEIDHRREDPAETVLPRKYPLTTVRLDCNTQWVCGDTSAAMVYPAEPYTTGLFKRAPKIRDKTGQLAHFGLDLVRFVEPEYIRVLRDFRHEP